MEKQKQKQSYNKQIKEIQALLKNFYISNIHLENQIFNFYNFVLFIYIVINQNCLYEIE